MVGLFFKSVSTLTSKGVGSIFGLAGQKLKNIISHFLLSGHHRGNNVSTWASANSLTKQSALEPIQKHGPRFSHPTQTIPTQRVSNSSSTDAKFAIFPPHRLYRGYTVVLLRNSCSDVVFFSLRIPLREFVLRRFQQFDPKARDRTGLLMMANFISGALLGTTISTIFYPLNVVKTRMQANCFHILHDLMNFYD